MPEVSDREDVSERAAEEWEVVINPFPLYDDVLFMLYFKHRDHPFKFFHRYYRSLHDARQEQRRIDEDLKGMRCDKFKEKYRIGHDLKRSL